MLRPLAGNLLGLRRLSTVETILPVPEVHMYCTGLFASTVCKVQGFSLMKAYYDKKGAYY